MSDVAVSVLLRLVVPSLGVTVLFLLVVSLLEEWATRGYGRDPDYNLSIGLVKWLVRMEILRALWHLASYMQRASGGFAGITPDAQFQSLLNYGVAFAFGLFAPAILFFITRKAGPPSDHRELQTRERMVLRRNEYNQSEKEGGRL